MRATRSSLVRTTLVATVVAVAPMDMMATGTLLTSLRTSPTVTRLVLTVSTSTSVRPRRQRFARKQLMEQTLPRVQIRFLATVVALALLGTLATGMQLEALFQAARLALVVSTSTLARNYWMQMD